MSKKNRNKQFQQNNVPKKNEPMRNLNELKVEALDLNNNAKIEGEKAGITPQEPPPLNGNIAENDLRDAIRNALAAQEIFQKLSMGLSEQQKALETKQAELQKQSEEFDQKSKPELAELRKLKQEKEQEFKDQRDVILREANGREELLNERERDLNRRERILQETIDARIADEKARFDVTIEGNNKRISGLEKACDDLREACDDARDALRRGGGEGVPALQRENNTLNETVKQLREQLAARPEHDQTDEVNRLTREMETYRDRNEELSQDRARLEYQLTQNMVGALEVQNLRDAKEILEKRCEVLKVAADSLKHDVDEILARNQADDIFPSLREISMSPDFSKQQDDIDDEAVNLETIVKDFRNELARTGFYYSLEDLRCFIAGMASSRLLILQGLSGTGKTSLPRLFSKLINSEQNEDNIIAVQAGWRDRSDLLGHFNAFENKYYESEFLKALYRAGMPWFVEKPYLIILDEMNLSHAEQYFADFISLLELNAETDELPLLPFSPVLNAPIPRLKVDKGVYLEIPKNVWFVGTANHDETTMDFADKTYDRAHIMELPHRAQHFAPPRAQSNLQNLSVDSLNAAFETARRNRRIEANNAIERFGEVYRGIFNDRFSLNWGNRLEEQMRSFVPVIRASGGTLSEAMDHIIVTKLLRKLLNRHDNQRQDLQELRNVLTKNSFGGNLQESLACIDRLERNAN